MTEYKCGHESDVVLMDSNPLSISAYFTWTGSSGYEGNKTQCFKCFSNDRRVKCVVLDADL